jgi:hypothetical protein
VIIPACRPQSTRDSADGCGTAKSSSGPRQRAPFIKRAGWGPVFSCRWPSEGKRDELEVPPDPASVGSFHTAGAPKLPRPAGFIKNLSIKSQSAVRNAICNFRSLDRIFECPWFPRRVRSSVSMGFAVRRALVLLALPPCVVQFMFVTGSPAAAFAADGKLYLVGNRWDPMQGAKCCP